MAKISSMELPTCFLCVLQKQTKSYLSLVWIISGENQKGINAANWYSV